MKTQKMNGNSHDPQTELLAKLQKEMPEVFSEGKIDFSKFKATLGEDGVAEGERYGLSWAGKSDCFRQIQETTTNTLKPCREESVNFDNTDNLFIEGDNLQAMKVLQKSYYGKVKMIYIDPHLLGYTKWDNFVSVISKAKTACEISGNNISDHFANASEMVLPFK